MEYQTFSISVQGESHKAKEIVMQDFSGHKNGKIKIAVVSDGHGSPDCFRSDRGSALAVKVCMEGLSIFAEEFGRGSGSMPERKMLQKENLRQFCSGIIGNWNLAVNEDLEKFPVTDEEMENCSETWRTLYRKKQYGNHMYGATLIGMLLFENQLLVFHQGDGRCVLITKDGDFCEPVPWDEDCQGNLTTSLCDDDAAVRMRFYCRTVDEKDAIAAVFAASDGIEDSYRDHEIMYNFYRRFCIRAAEEGLEKTCAFYETQELGAISKSGSGDDMSLAGIVNLDLLGKFQEKWNREIEQVKNKEIMRRTGERLPAMEKKRKYLQKQIEEKEEEKRALFLEKKKEEEKRTELENRLQRLAEEKENNQSELVSLQERTQDLEEELQNCKKKWEETDLLYNGLRQELRRECRGLQMIFGTFLEVLLGDEGIKKTREHLLEQRDRLLEIRREKRKLGKKCTDLSRLAEEYEAKKQQKETLLQNIELSRKNIETTLKKNRETLLQLKKRYEETEHQGAEREEAAREYEEKYQQQAAEHQAAAETLRKLEGEQTDERKNQKNSNGEISIF